MTSLPYRAYFQAESIGSMVFALTVFIGFSIYAALPCFMGYKDKYYNMRRTIQMIFPYIKKEKRANTATNGESNTENQHRNTEYDTKIFNNYIIQEWYLFCLWFLLLGVIIATVVIFWLNFFIERSSKCDPNDTFDCYPNKPSLNILDETPLTNCSVNDAKCFRFTCNIGNAVGLATGAFAFSWVTASAFLWIIIQLGGNALKKTENNENDCNCPCNRCIPCPSSEYECSCLKNSNCCLCAYVTCVIVFQAFTFLSAVGLLVVCFLLYFHGKISITCYYEVITFCILIVVTSLVIWCYGFKNHRIKMRRNQEGSNQSNAMEMGNITNKTQSTSVPDLRGDDHTGQHGRRNSY